MLTNDIVGFEQLGPRMLYLQNDKLNFSDIKKCWVLFEIEKRLFFQLVFSYIDKL